MDPKQQNDERLHCEDVARRAREAVAAQSVLTPKSIEEILYRFIREERQRVREEERTRARGLWLKALGDYLEVQSKIAMRHMETHGPK